MEDNQTHFLLSIHRIVSYCKTKLFYYLNDNYIQDDCKKFNFLKPLYLLHLDFIGLILTLVYQFLMEL